MPASKSKKRTHEQVLADAVRNHEAYKAEVLKLARYAKPHPDESEDPQHLAANSLFDDASRVRFQRSADERKKANKLLKKYKDIKVYADRSTAIREDLKEELQNESLKDEFKEEIRAALADTKISRHKLFGLLAESRGVPRKLAGYVYAQHFAFVKVPKVPRATGKSHRKKKATVEKRVATAETKNRVQELIQRLSDLKGKDRKDRKGRMIEELILYMLDNGKSTDEETQKSLKRIERKVLTHEDAIGEGRRGFSALQLLKFYAAELNVELSLADIDRVKGPGGEGAGAPKKSQSKKGASKEEKDAKFAKQVWQAVAMGAASAREHLQELAKGGVQ